MSIGTNGIVALLILVGLLWMLFCPAPVTPRPRDPDPRNKS